MEKSRNHWQSSTPRSAWRIVFWKYAGFYLHFALTALVAAAVLLILDGRAFNINSRQPTYQETDGSLSHLSSYGPTQSDITTGISLAATVTRVAAGWWSGGYLWRCIFVSMERGGITLEGLSKVLSNWSWPLLAPRHFKRTSNMWIIWITLFATFAIDYFSATLTGSIIWEPSRRLIPASSPVTGIVRGVSGANVATYFTYSDLQSSVVEFGTASANLAWAAIQSNSTNITEPSTTFRRVLDGTRFLPINSTLNNVRIPYFVVNAFEWIKDPDSILTDQQKSSLFDYGSFSPYFSGSFGKIGLLPDKQWGPPNANNLGDPHIVSESRLLSFRVERRSATEVNDGPCPQPCLIDPGIQVNLHQLQSGTSYYDCFAIANVTYQAGAAVCQNCEIFSPTVVQAKSPLPLIPDSFTTMALGLAPSLGTWLNFSGYAVPRNYDTRRDLAIELTSRSYQAAWAAYSDRYGNMFEETDVQISLPTSRVKVISWRVYLWAALHLSVLMLGLLFVYIQSYCDHPWVEDPTMAVFWLDTSAIPSSSDGQDIDPWQPGTELPSDGMLILENAGDGSRSVMISK
ncbi:hypothetical protein BYT27DRAFT_7104827 [Phlegmacium glaucopus]|nr:hypothetical protein BYT27DRAFT_7104827 [Phlegmacium glaucopus]